MVSLKNDLTEAATLVGGVEKLGKILGKSYPVIYYWGAVGHLPHTEWSGATDYAERIERATYGRITKERLLSYKPARAK